MDDIYVSWVGRGVGTDLEIMYSGGRRQKVNSRDSSTTYNFEDIDIHT